MVLDIQVELLIKFIINDTEHHLLLYQISIIQFSHKVLDLLFISYEIQTGQHFNLQISQYILQSLHIFSSQYSQLVSI